MNDPGPASDATPPAMATRTIDVNGVPYAYREQGSGPLVLFAHGTLGAKEMFVPQIDALSDRYRCVAFDWPGHGGSGFDPAGWTVTDLVDAIPVLLDALGEHSAILVGLSQGGVIFLRTALRHRSRVLALVTLSAGPDRPAQAGVATLRKLAQLLCDGGDSQRIAAVKQLQENVFHAPGWVAEHPREAEWERRLILAHDRNAMPLAARIPAGYDSVEHRLSEITCPTLVVWGEHDVRAGWGEPMVKAIPNARLRVIRDAGHHVTIDQPTETTQAIAAFIDTQV